MRLSFPLVRNAIAVTAVLDQYRIAYRETRGDVFRLPCPIHGGVHPSFAVFLTTNTWHCFSKCKMGGDVIALVAALEECSQVKALRLLADWFPDGTGLMNVRSAVEERRVRPLILDSTHPSLSACAATPDVVVHFGVGFIETRHWGPRIACPVHDEYGQLVGYAFRAVSEGQQPRWTLSKGMEKGHVLYNLHRVGTPYVVLVEGIRDVWHLSEAGIPAVALIGSELSRTQKMLLCQRFREVALMFDGDEAGAQGAARAYRMLDGFVTLRDIMLRTETDPADLDVGEIDKLLVHSGFHN